MNRCIVVCFFALVIIFSIVGVFLVRANINNKPTTTTVLLKTIIRKKDLKTRAVEYNRLVPYTKSIRVNPPSGTATMFNSKITYGFAQRNHLNLIVDHIKREKFIYKIMRSATVVGNGIVVDIGSNHGLYALFAASWGKHVIAVEPQEKLCRLINWSLRINKIEKLVSVYDIAILNSRENVNMVDAHIAEGAVGTIQKTPGNIPAYPMDELVPRNTDISFLKIDVEGSDIEALQSSYSLFGDKLVDNVVVEFGPPSRWKRALGMSSNEGLELLNKMHGYGFEIRLLAISQVYSEFSKKRVDGDATLHHHELKDMQGWRALINSMNTCNCESYLWFVRNTKEMDADMYRIPYEEEKYIKNKLL